MRVKQIKLLLWTLTVVFAAATVVVVAAAAAGRGLGTSGSTLTLNGANSTVVASSVRSTSRLPPLAELETLCRQDLRRPLYDAPPPVPITAPPPPPVAPLPFKLAGTVIEPGHSQALLQMSDGKIQFNRVGDSVGGPSAGINTAQILQIDRDSITLMYHGRQQVLNVEKQEQPKGS